MYKKEAFRSILFFLVAQLCYLGYIFFSTVHYFQIKETSFLAILRMLAPKILERNDFLTQILL